MAKGEKQGARAAAAAAKEKAHVPLVQSPPKVENHPQHPYDGCRQERDSLSCRRSIIWFKAAVLTSYPE